MNEQLLSEPEIGESDRLFTPSTSELSFIGGVHLLFGTLIFPPLARDLLDEDEEIEDALLSELETGESERFRILFSLILVEIVEFALVSVGEDIV